MERSHVFRISTYGWFMQQEKILLVRSKVKESTIVNFPGGKVEWGENPQDSLIREFSEETGIKVRVDRLLFASNEKHIFDSFPYNHCFCVYYSVTSLDTEPKFFKNDTDIIEVFWHKIEELPHVDMGSPEIEFCKFAKNNNFFKQIN